MRSGRRLYKEVKIPPGTEIQFGGLYQVQRESFLGLVQVLLMSIVLIFVILVFEFRSFSHPIAILVATILCGSGALLALLVTGNTLNIASFMGAIMVVGIVQKNGILMLDSEKHFTAEGLGLRDAIFQAGRRRLRPILMTAIATICGMLPLAIGVGLRRSTSAAAGDRGNWRRHRLHGVIAADYAGAVLQAT